MDVIEAGVKIEFPGIHAVVITTNFGLMLYHINTKDSANRWALMSPCCHYIIDVDLFENPYCGQCEKQLSNSYLNSYSEQYFELVEAVAGDFFDPLTATLIATCIQNYLEEKLELVECVENLKSQPGINSTFGVKELEEINDKDFISLTTLMD